MAFKSFLYLRLLKASHISYDMPLSPKGGGVYIKKKGLELLLIPWVGGK